MNIFEDFIKFYNNRNSDNWNFAENYIPDFFELKYLIHWDYGIIDNFPFDKYPLENGTFEEMNKRVRIEQEFNVLLKEEKFYKQISILELAKRFNVTFSHKTIDLIPETPGVSVLDNLSIAKLKKSLKLLSKKDKLNLLIFDAGYHKRHFDFKEKYINIDLEKYFEIQDIFSFQLDTCLFPDNRDWCLITAEEVPILFGCKKEIENEIINKFALELFELKNKEEIH
tara:strand:+ start:74 stop:751 length:678 start_codon:yes stop_codon:yes gene_type:complete